MCKLNFINLIEPIYLFGGRGHIYFSLCVHVCVCPGNDLKLAYKERYIELQILKLTCILDIKR